MDRGAWWVPVHGVAKSRTELSDFLFPWLKWDSKGFFLPAGGSSGVGRGQRLPKLRSLKTSLLLLPPTHACGVQTSYRSACITSLEGR